jgi:LuxR family maltose regulon positive regulatory protein
MSELHRRAARWHLDAGRSLRRSGHTIAAGDHDVARELIAGHWAPMMMVTAGERTRCSPRPGGSSRRGGRARAAAEGLSERELMVLRLLATSLTQREIGRELFLSLNTVKSYTRSIFRKLRASSREQAVARARELELI